MRLMERYTRLELAYVRLKKRFEMVRRRQRAYKCGRMCCLYRAHDLSERAFR